MPKRDATPVRDDDLDHRPFGDSHFGTPNRDRFRLERPRILGSAAKQGSRPDGKIGAELPVLLSHSWHEGFFEEFDSPLQPPTPRKHAGHRSHVQRGTPTRPPASHTTRTAHRP